MFFLTLLCGTESQYFFFKTFSSAHRIPKYCLCLAVIFWGFLFGRFIFISPWNVIVLCFFLISGFSFCLFFFPFFFLFLFPPLFSLFSLSSFFFAVNFEIVVTYLGNNTEPFSEFRNFSPSQSVGAPLLVFPFKIFLRGGLSWGTPGALGVFFPTSPFWRIFSQPFLGGRVPFFVNSLLLTPRC